MKKPIRSGCTAAIASLALFAALPAFSQMTSTTTTATPATTATPNVGNLIANGRSELAAGRVDSAKSIFAQAFQQAKASGDVSSLLQLTQAYHDASLDPDAVASFQTAVSLAHDKACFSATVTNSGNNVSQGRADLSSIVGFFANHFGTSNPAASGLQGSLSTLNDAAEGYLHDIGKPNCLPAPNLNGSWCFRGVAGQLCSITQQSTGNLTLVTEKNVQMEGHLTDASHFAIDSSSFAGSTGTISADGNRIDWSNGENWQRCSQ